MKLECSVDMTYVNAIPKFGYDHSNTSWRNGLLKNRSNPSKLDGHKKHNKIKWSCFHHKWWTIFQKVGGFVVVTNVKVIFKFDHINISYRYVLLKNMSNPSS